MLHTRSSTRVSATSAAHGYCVRLIHPAKLAGPFAVRSTPASLAGWEVRAIYHAHSTVQNVATRRGTAPSGAPAFRAAQPDPGRWRSTLRAHGSDRCRRAVWGHS